MCEENMDVIFEDIFFFLLILPPFLALKRGKKSLTSAHPFLSQSDWFWILLFTSFPEL